jgi:hypothetical protein
MSVPYGPQVGGLDLNPVFWTSAVFFGVVILAAKSRTFRRLVMALLKALLWVLKALIRLLKRLLRALERFFRIVEKWFREFGEPWLRKNISLFVVVTFLFWATQWTLVGAYKSFDSGEWNWLGALLLVGSSLLYVPQQLAVIRRKWSRHSTDDEFIALMLTVDASQMLFGILGIVCDALAIREQNWGSGNGVALGVDIAAWLWGGLCFYQTYVRGN